LPHGRINIKADRQAERKVGRMILGIETDSGWVLWDGFNRIQHRPVDPQCGYETSSLIDLRGNQLKVIGSQPATVGVEIELFKDGIFIERIFTQGAAYVMNDRGETIKKI
jgi:hypothetical protein